MTTSLINKDLKHGVLRSWMTPAEIRKYKILEAKETAKNVAVAVILTAILMLLFTVKQHG